MEKKYKYDKSKFFHFEVIKLFKQAGYKDIEIVFIGNNINEYTLYGRMYKARGEENMNAKNNFYDEDIDTDNFVSEEDIEDNDDE
jgi:hypothetical protein